MARTSYAGVLVGVGGTEVSLATADSVPLTAGSQASVRQLAGGGRRAVSSPSRDIGVEVTAHRLTHADVSRLLEWRGQVVRVRFGWRAPLWCLLAAVTVSYDPGADADDRAGTVAVRMAATTLTAADAS